MHFGRTGKFRSSRAGLTSGRQPASSSQVHDVKDLPVTGSCWPGSGRGLGVERKPRRDPGSRRPTSAAAAAPGQAVETVQDLAVVGPAIT